MEFYEHVMIGGGLEHLAVTGKIEGWRVRPRVRYVKALSRRARADAIELMKTTKSRVEWRAMIANALKEHGT